MSIDMRTAKNLAGVLLLALALPCGCRVDTAPAEARPRDGVLDIPVETAPREVWMASRTWKEASALVSVVALSSGDRRNRSVTYFLELGFPGEDDHALRQAFHQRLLDMGWHARDVPGSREERAYVMEGRRLFIAYDEGRHPTSLMLKYGKENTSAGGSGAVQP